MFDNKEYGFLTSKDAITLLNRLYEDNLKLTQRKK